MAGRGDIDEALRRRLADALRRLERGEHPVHDDPRKPGQLIRAALGYAKIGDTQTQDAIARIYLTVLMDDGLAAAVVALTELFTLSITVDVDPIRLVQPVEAAAYFLVAETLTIVDEQPGAKRLHVAAHRAGSSLVVEISHDGADPFRPDRLAELRRRVEAFDGTLDVVTQSGIGTRVRATFPHAVEDS